MLKKGGNLNSASTAPISSGLNWRPGVLRGGAWWGRGRQVGRVGVRDVSHGGTSSSTRPTLEGKGQEHAREVARRRRPLGYAGDHVK